MVVGVDSRDAFKGVSRICKSPGGDLTTTSWGKGKLEAEQKGEFCPFPCWPAYLEIAAIFALPKNRLLPHFKIQMKCLRAFSISYVNTEVEWRSILAVKGF